MADGLLDNRIVTIGGGTGGFVVNSGLAMYPVRPTAICTVFDDGGSTGGLKDEFGALPQGDIRRCLVALADDPDHTMRELFQHRFANSNGTSDISRHSLGNLFLLAGEQKWGPIDGLQKISKLLHIHGEVLPISIDKARLHAKLNDGTEVVGESKIDLRPLDDERTISKVWLEPSPVICREASDAIVNADVIVMGPGDLYTSIVPNLKVEGVAESIAKSKAKLVYVANLMTKWSETRGFSVADFLKVLHDYDVGREKFDAVLINTAPIPADLIALYAQKDKSTPILFTSEAVQETLLLAKKVIAEDFLNRNALLERLVRHDSRALAKTIIGL